MKIGILTFHFSDNFGAVLQCYALKSWLASQGHLVEVINYHPRHVEEGAPIAYSLSKKALKGNLKSLYLGLTKLKNSIFGDRSQRQKFDTFRTAVLAVNGSRLTESDNLQPLCNRYDLIIAGSDQIWSPSDQYGFDSNYFLSFCNGYRTRSISYAASFGRDTFDKSRLTELKILLNGLSSVSVRETSGLEIVANATGRTAACVPDPTILLTDYSELIESANAGERDHIFCYALRTSEGIRNVANTISQHLNSEIISPHNPHRRWREIGRTVHPGPADWVADIFYSKFVVTNSFHGTAFALLAKRPFLAVALPGKRIELNSRARNLLNQVGLSERLIETADEKEILKIAMKPIDWTLVHEKLADMRIHGEIFLREEIERAYSNVAV